MAEWYLPAHSPGRPLVEKTRHLENSGRVLNLTALEASLNLPNASVTQRPTRPAGVARRFFETAALNKSIFIKHYVRPWEQHLFVSPRHVETKILVPFDSTRLESGARSFFIDESSYEDILETFLRINPAARDKKTIHDLRILQILKMVPGFDPFILREALSAARITVDHRYFSARYDAVETAIDEVYSDLKPLIGAAVGKSATREVLRKFVEHVWNVTEPSAENLFFEALHIPRTEWHEVVFVWKALVYYRLEIKKEDSRLWELVSAMKSVRLADSSNIRDLKPLHELKHRFAVGLFRLRQQALERANQLSLALIDKMSRNLEASHFHAALRELFPSIVALGTDLTVFQQTVLYYKEQFGQLNCHVDAVVYGAVLRSLDELVSPRVST